MILFFFIGVKEEQIPLPEKIDVMLYENLGLVIGQDNITSSEQTYSRDEIVDAVRAESTLGNNIKNPLISNLKLSDAFKGIQKKATTYDVMTKGRAEQRTLIEIRFKSTKELDTLKILETIPKSTANSEEIFLSQGGVIAEKDPIIIFTFNKVKKDDVLKAVYIIRKKLATLDTATFPAEITLAKETPKEAIVCGDGKCVEGETYMTCCQDCGCTPGFVCTINACVPAEKDECQSETDCNDNDISTKDACTGKPKTCQHTIIGECVIGDGYCPQNCTYNVDTDCPQTLVRAVIDNVTEMNITGPQEPPNILNITITPENVTIGDEILVEAKVSDPNGKEDIQSVWLEVMELAQSHGESSDMLDDGANGDKTAGDGIYTAVGVISEYYLTGTYHINVYARDLAGNKKKMQKTFKVIGNET